MENKHDRLKRALKVLRTKREDRILCRRPSADSYMTLSDLNALIELVSAAVDPIR